MFSHGRGTPVAVDPGISGPGNLVRVTVYPARTLHLGYLMGVFYERGKPALVSGVACATQLRQFVRKDSFQDGF